MIVTKHCKPQDRLRMLEGHFKIGSHSEYSSAEKSGLLSDDAEGFGSTLVTGDVRGFSGTIAGSTFQNIWVESGDGISIEVEEVFNSLIFCTSAGDYAPDRHQRIINGDVGSNYSANPLVTAYLTLDMDRLQDALTHATNCIFQAQTRWVCRPVFYEERERKVKSEDFIGMSQTEYNARAYKQAFIKPKKFKWENEFRFLMLPSRKIDPPSVVFTNTLSLDVQRMFQSAIVDKGSDIASQLA